MKSRMDKNIRPCTDFYKYVCGNWDESKDDLLNANKITKSNLISTIRDILQNQSSHVDNFKLSMERKFYNSCIDTSKSREEGQNLFMQIVNDNRGRSWQNALEYYATKVGEISLFRISISAGNVLRILRPYTSSSNIAKYIQPDIYVPMFFELTGPSNNYYLEKKELNDLVNNVNKLVHDPPSALIPMSISEFQKDYDIFCFSQKLKINWLQFLKKVAGNDGVHLTSSDPIQVEFKHILSLCNILRHVSDYTIVNFLHYSFIMDLNTNLFIYKEFDKAFSNDDRSNLCIEKIPIYDGLNDEIVDYYIPHDNQEMVNKMFEMIKDELLTEIEDSWLEKDAKRAIIDKAEKIKFKFNMVHKAVSTSQKQGFSYEFDITPVALQNLINFKVAQIKHKFQTYMRSLALRRSKRDIIINAVYGPDSNILYVSPGLMLPVLFHPEAPAAYNFGMLGFIIGHEISHAFDFENCKRFLTRASLTDQQTFATKNLCFENQFDTFNINGTNTLNENVADTQGLKLAFKAMKKFINANKTEKLKKLPGFQKFYAKELFFISFANQFCANPNKNVYEGGEYPPHEFRVRGPLMNMKEFAKIFSCRQEDPMNPVKKCDLWKKTKKSKSSCSKLICLHG